MKGNLVKGLVCFFLVMLSACSSQTVKDDVGEQSKAVPIFNIDKSVEKDFNNAVALMQSGNYELAVTILKSVVEREQRLPAPYANLGIAYDSLDDKTMAEENYIKALKLDIGHAEANNGLGIIYRKAGKFKAAKTAYENAIEANPSYLPAKKNLGILCDLYLHDFECAHEQFSAYLEARPEDKQVAVWVADVKRRL